MPNSFLSRTFSYDKHQIFVFRTKFAKSEFTKCVFSVENLRENARKVLKCLHITKYCRKFAVKSETKTYKEMKRVKATSQKGQHFLSAYECATSRSVKEYYKKASYAKISAENSILRSIGEAFRNTYRVISGNTFSFTAAYQTEEGLVVETPGNCYLVVE